MVLGCGDRDRVGPPGRLRLARAPEGFVRSVLALLGADLDAPDHTTRSRRSQQIAVMLRCIPATGPIHLIVDSTGLSIVGQGAWAVSKHGGHGKRGWKKLHLGVDRSGVIVAQALTDAPVDDAMTAVDLIPVVDGDLSSQRMPPTTRSRSTRRRARVVRRSSFLRRGALVHGATRQG